MRQIAGKLAVLPGSRGRLAATRGGQPGNPSVSLTNQKTKLGLVPAPR
jgi:hypothetical protein